MKEKNNSEDLLVKLDKKSMKILPDNKTTEGRDFGTPGVSLLVFVALIPVVLALVYIVVGLFQSPDEILSSLPEIFKVLGISIIVFVILGISVTKSSYNLLRGVRHRSWLLTFCFIANLVIFALMPEESPSIQELFSFKEPFIYMIATWLTFSILNTSLVKSSVVKSKYWSDLLESILVLLSFVMGLSVVMFILIDGASILRLIVDYS